MKKTYPMHRTPAKLARISGAVALLCMAAAAQAQSDSKVQLKPVEITGVAPVTLEASEVAPSQSSLDARTATSIVSDKAIRDYMTPLGDYTQAISMTPGAFSYTPNGVGLGDAKVTVRGLSDSNMVLSFEGIPFNDTNGVSHHSWVFFPDDFLGGAVIDRSPGTAATIGQATFGGNVDLRSRKLEAEPVTSVMATYGSWETSVLGIEHQTGQFGEEGKSSLMFNLQGMNSSGYEILNKQARLAGSAKYQYAENADTTYTLFASMLELKNNTPNIKGVTRLNYNAGDYVDMLSSNAALGNYYGFNFYDIQTDFEYLGLNTKLDNGWVVDDKLYRYSYHNKQNYANSAAALPVNGNIAVAGTDKLNSYITNGNLLRMSEETGTGTLRTGLWLEQARSYRFQSPTNPLTWTDEPLPNFSENYTTTTAQPYAEYEFKINDRLKVTPGVKYASYTQDFVHAQDNGGAVGLLGGTAGPVVNGVTTSATGGASTLANSITYTDWLPSLDVHYMLQPNWSLYGQYSAGDQIPSTSVFDVKNAAVNPAPKATRSTGLQFGTVWNAPQYTFAADIYQITLDGSYTALPPDANGNVGYVLSGTEVSQGLELESSVVLGNGFNLYMNGSLGSVKYDTGMWVAGAPSDTETVQLTYVKDVWDVSLSANRVGQMFADDKAGNHEAFNIAPVVLWNMFVNYTVKSPNPLTKQAKVQVGVNNLLDSHAITGIASPAAGSTGAAPSNTDLLTVVPGRSVMVTLTLDF